MSFQISFVNYIENNTLIASNISYNYNFQNNQNDFNHYLHDSYLINNSFNNFDFNINMSKIDYSTFGAFNTPYDQINQTYLSSLSMPFSLIAINAGQILNNNLYLALSASLSLGLGYYLWHEISNPFNGIYKINQSNDFEKLNHQLPNTVIDENKFANLHNENTPKNFPVMIPEGDENTSKNLINTLNKDLSIDRNINIKLKSKADFLNAKIEYIAYYLIKNLFNPNPHNIDLIESNHRNLIELFSKDDYEINKIIHDASNNYLNKFRFLYDKNLYLNIFFSKYHLFLFIKNRIVTLSSLEVFLSQIMKVTEPKKHMAQLYGFEKETTDNANIIFLGKKIEILDDLITFDPLAPVKKYSAVVDARLSVDKIIDKLKDPSLNLSSMNLKHRIFNNLLKYYSIKIDLSNSKELELNLVIEFIQSIEDEFNQYVFLDRVLGVIEPSFHYARTADDDPALTFMSNFLQKFNLKNTKEQDSIDKDLVNLFNNLPDETLVERFVNGISLKKYVEKLRGSSQADVSLQAEGSLSADGSLQAEGSSQAEGSFLFDGSVMVTADLIRSFVLETIINKKRKFEILMGLILNLNSMTVKNYAKKYKISKSLIFNYKKMIKFEFYQYLNNSSRLLESVLLKYHSFDNDALINQFKKADLYHLINNKQYINMQKMKKFIDEILLNDQFKTYVLLNLILKIDEYQLNNMLNIYQTNRPWIYKTKRFIKDKLIIFLNETILSLDELSKKFNSLSDIDLVNLIYTNIAPDLNINHVDIKLLKKALEQKLNTDFKKHIFYSTVLKLDEASHKHLSKMYNVSKDKSIVTRFRVNKKISKFIDGSIVSLPILESRFKQLDNHQLKNLFTSNNQDIILKVMESNPEIINNQKILDQFISAEKLTDYYHQLKNNDQKDIHRHVFLSTILNLDEADSSEIALFYDKSKEQIRVINQEVFSDIFHEKYSNKLNLDQLIKDYHNALQQDQQWLLSSVKDFLRKSYYFKGANSANSFLINHLTIDDITSFLENKLQSDDLSLHVFLSLVLKLDSGSSSSIAKMYNTSDNLIRYRKKHMAKLFLNDLLD